MGNKINPIGLRTPKILNWKSRWCGDFSKNIREDFKIRKYIYEINKKFVEEIYIERNRKYLIIVIYSSKPGFIIGKKGKKIKKIKDFFKKKQKLYIIVKEIKNIEINSNYISKNICFHIEKRKNYKRVINSSIEKAMEFAIRGIKIEISGRINGNDIARKEKFIYGKIPINKIESKISYSKSCALTKYGIICVKVWINF